MPKSDSNHLIKEEKEEPNSNISKESKKEEEKNAEESKISTDLKNNSNHDESNENENENDVKVNSDEIKIEVIDKGINTDHLNSSELERLIKENKDLNQDLNDKGSQINDEIFNVGHDTSEISETKKKLMQDLTEHDKVINILKQSNHELNNKIKLSEKKFEEIKQKIKDKKDENEEDKLQLKIKELEKEIKANNNETERYKKLIEKLKIQIEFKEGINRASNFQKLLKQENLKNIELKEKLTNLTKVYKYQERYMENYKKKYKTKEREGQLQKEISKNKNLIKEYNNKYYKLDRFTRIAHSKIIGLRVFVGKLINNEPKVEEKKIFTNEETKDALQIITNLKSQINGKRKELEEIQKKSENKIHDLLVQNKQIELDFIENKRIYKNLLFKKNELNKKLRNLNNENNKNKNEPKKNSK